MQSHDFVWNFDGRQLNWCVLLKLELSQHQGSSVLPPAGAAKQGHGRLLWTLSLAATSVILTQCAQGQENFVGKDIMTFPAGPSYYMPFTSIGGELYCGCNSTDHVAGDLTSETCKPAGACSHHFVGETFSESVPSSLAVSGA